MKKILIIYPHFPPSNLAGVHRPRLFAQHLPSFGWEPIILTVDEKYYEESPDWNLVKLLPATLRIEKVKAFPLTKPRFVGDIGLRAFFQLYKKAKQLIRSEKIDFLFIPIPSFYSALLGRWLHATTGIKYGIDYIDPWVHDFPGSEKLFSRHWFSSKIARLLEPVAVKKASLITGVAEGYYHAVLERNSSLKKQAVFGAMPYGGEKADHENIQLLGVKPTLFTKRPGKVQLVYAGAMLPKAYGPLESIFKAMVRLPTIFENLEIHFIGTGKTNTNAEGYNIRNMSQQYGLWQKQIFEYPQRIAYMDVLVHLNASDGVFILGSTEPHYTPSKVYQSILSGKPILAVLHQDSSAVRIIKQSGGGLVLGFDGEAGLPMIEHDFAALAAKYFEWIKSYNVADINEEVIEQYSAKNITRQLATLLNKVAE